MYWGIYFYWVQWALGTEVWGWLVCESLMYVVCDRFVLWCMFYVGPP